MNDTEETALFYKLMTTKLLISREISVLGTKVQKINNSFLAHIFHDDVQTSHNWAYESTQNWVCNICPLNTGVERKQE